MIVQDPVIAPYELTYDHKGWKVQAGKNYEPMNSLQDAIQYVIGKKLANDTSVVTLAQYVKKEGAIRKAIQDAFTIEEETKENVETSDQSSIALTE